MIGNMKNSFAEYLSQIFVEREFFLRSDGKVRFMRISRSTQISALALGLLIAAWVIYASFGVVFHNQIVAGKMQHIERQRLTYFDLLNEVTEYQQQFKLITRNLEDNQAYLLSLLARSTQDAEELAGIEWQLKDSGSEKARVRIAREGLRQRLEDFESELSDIVSGNPSLRGKVEDVLTAFASEQGGTVALAKAEEHLGRRLDQVEEELGEVKQKRVELEAALASLQGELAQSENAREDLTFAKASLNQNVLDLESNLGEAGELQTILEEQIATLESALSEATNRGEELAGERDVLGVRVAGLEQRLGDMHGTQQTIVDRLTERTQTSIDTFEQNVAMTGLDVDRMLSQLQTATTTLGEDQGGPFIPDVVVLGHEQDPVSSLKSSIVMLDLQMDRWESLQRLVRELPLISPLDQFRVTSPYGPRYDPVNKRKSKHHGLDLAAPMGTPILATAPGKVVFAGWKGRYGRTIDVDHGNGIRTRYAHLRKILVKRGQEVGFREQIGLLGSSGRSTGPHVHYEVKVNGKPFNPMNFMMAGANVFQG